MRRQANLFDIVLAVGVDYVTLGDLRNEEYRRATVPKKDSGTRVVYQPPNLLGVVQDRLRAWLQELLPVHDAAHAVRGRSTTTNARVHEGAVVMFKADIRDFFPSITAEMVGSVLEPFEPAARAMVVELTTTVLEPTQVYGRGRRLPQGAPSSPLLANVVCRALDEQLKLACAGWSYTRYMDDLTFSRRDDRVDPRELEPLVAALVQAQGFSLHPLKTRALGRRDRKEVTGVMVGGGPGLGTRAPRALWRLARAMVHRIVTRRVDAPPLSEAKGLLAYLAQTDYERAKRYEKELEDAD